MSLLESLFTAVAQPLIERLTGKTRDERERTHALQSLADAENARAQSDARLAEAENARAQSDAQVAEALEHHALANEHLAQAVERLTDPPAATHTQQAYGASWSPHDDFSGPASLGHSA